MSSSRSFVRGARSALMVVVLGGAASLALGGCLAESQQIRTLPDSGEEEDAGALDAARDSGTSDARPRDAGPDAGRMDATPPDAGFDEYFWWPDVQPIVQAKCVSCHGAEPIRGASAPLVTWADTQRIDLNTGLAVYRVMSDKVSGVHPAPPDPQVTATERTKIQGWAAYGGPEGTPPGSDAGPNLDAGAAD